MIIVVMETPPNIGKAALNDLRSDIIDAVAKAPSLELARQDVEVIFNSNRHLPEFHQQIIIFVLKVIDETVRMDNMDDLVAQTIEKTVSRFFSSVYRIKYSFATFHPAGTALPRGHHEQIDKIPIEECLSEANFQRAGVNPRYIKCRIIRGLEYHRIWTLGDIQSASPKRMRSIKNLGDKGLSALRQVLNITYDIDL